MSGNERFLNVLPLPLESRLNVLIEGVKQFWRENSHIDYIYKSGPTHSERIYLRRLTDLSEALQEKNINLNDEERFILFAAAWLYEVGMQSNRLQEILGPGFKTDQLTDEQKEIIHSKRNILTYDLLQNAAQTGQPGGLPAQWDDYMVAIADLCKYCSPDPQDPISAVPSETAVRGVKVRMRLLAAILCLADRLDIDATRVDITRLEKASLPIALKARRWAYLYTQLLIENGIIRLYFQMPRSQEQYTGHVRSLIETAIENDQLISYLIAEYHVHLSLHPQPALNLIDGVLTEMNDDVIGYVRQLPDRSIDPKISQPTERPLFLLDYETLIIQMGEAGYFFTPEEFQNHLTKLMQQAASQYLGVLRCIAFGNWERPDMADARDRLKILTFETVSIRERKDIAGAIRETIGVDLESGKSSSKEMVFVCPHETVAQIISEAIERKRNVSTWITNHEDANLFRVFKPFKLIPDLLGLPPLAQPIDRKKLESDRVASILQLWDRELTHGEIDLGDVDKILNEIPELSAPPTWLRQWLLSAGILRVKPSKNQVALNKEHKLVSQVRSGALAAITTIEGAQTDSHGLHEHELIAALRGANVPDRLEWSAFLHLLNGAGALIYDPDENIWFSSSDNTIRIDLNLEFYIPLFLIGLDHALLKESYSYLHEHTLSKNLAPYLAAKVVEIIYRRALEQYLVLQQKTDRKRHTGEDLVTIRLNMRNLEVLTTLRNRNILFDVLYRQKEGIGRKALMSRLKSIESFTADTEQVATWLIAFQREQLIEVMIGDDDKDDILRLNTVSELARRVLGRNNVCGLVKSLRILKATRPEQTASSVDLCKKMTQYETHGDQNMATWTIDYGKSIRLVIPREGNETQLYLESKHRVVHALDDHERTLSQKIAEMVGRLQGKQDGVLRSVLEKNVGRDIATFGHTREEHAYWIDQAIHRSRLLKETYIQGHADSTGRKQRQILLTLASKSS